MPAFYKHTLLTPSSICLALDSQWHKHNMTFWHLPDGSNEPNANEANVSCQLCFLCSTPFFNVLTGLVCSASVLIQQLSEITVERFLRYPAEPPVSRKRLVCTKTEQCWYQCLKIRAVWDWQSTPPASQIGISSFIQVQGHVTQNKN